jgi:hypothetical protein
MHTIAYNPSLIAETNRRVFEALRDLGRELLKPFQVGFAPDESESLRLDVILKKANVATFPTNTDSAADMELMLFTNVAPGETITEAALTEPTGTGYARITLTDASWTGTGDTRSYAQQTFTAGAGGWTGSVQGYAIVTKAQGTGTKRIVVIEVDPNGPYTFAENASYDITPNISAT